MSIRFIGLDLDRTTLRSNGAMSEKTVATLGEAEKAGAHVVIATGRSYYSMPDDVRKVEGIEYTINSNGAEIRELESGRTIYSNCIDEREIDGIAQLLSARGFVIEVFTDGRAYMDREQYNGVRDGLCPRRARDYVVRTRNPVDDIYSFLKEHRNAVENINIFFDTDEEKAAMWDELSSLENVTITTSLPDNIEIGGSTTSKATAISWLAEKLGVEREEIMCCGDSLNDMAMLELAGTAVAMANGCDEIRSRADYITLSNDEDGVAEAVSAFVLGNENSMSLMSKVMKSADKKQ